MPAFFVIDQLSSDDRFDLSADHTCFGLSCICLCHRICIKEQDLTSGKRRFCCRQIIHLNIGDQFWKFDPGIECRIIIIFYISEIPVHDLAKNKIDIKEHFLSASEIFVQLDLLIFGVFRRIGIVFFHEQLRAGKTEPVNALLDITNHKQIVLPHAASGNAGQDQLLDHVAVLIFIDHDLFELL